MSDETRLDVALQHLADTRRIVDRLVANERTTLTEALRVAREDKGLTQQEVADAVGVARSQISNIERGDGVSVESLIAYAAAVGLRLNLQQETRA